MPQGQAADSACKRVTMMPQELSAGQKWVRVTEKLRWTKRLSIPVELKGCWNQVFTAGTGEWDT